VPFWFAVAPTVSTKLLISFGMPSSSSPTRSAVGSVALDDEVEQDRADEPPERDQQAHAELLHVVEDEAEHGERRELHDEADEPADEIAEGLEGGEQGLHALAGQQGRAEADGEREEHQVQHVRRRRRQRRERVARHDRVDDLRQWRGGRGRCRGGDLRGSRVAVRRAQRPGNRVVQLQPGLDQVGERDADAD
jgi:hypothetical protein